MWKAGKKSLKRYGFFIIFEAICFQTNILKISLISFQGYVVDVDNINFCWARPIASVKNIFNFVPYSDDQSAIFNFE